jgi:aspartyl-tRNA(Asn)/glutamyl-tRNA(Gln) amidotransferase subunit A
LTGIAGHALTPRIYARLTEARARAEAMAAASRAKTGFRKGPLDGVPISWKDLFDTAGVATEAGSALLKRPHAARDAAVLAQATLRAGLPGQDAYVGTWLFGPGAEPGDGDAALPERRQGGAGGVVLGGGGLGRLRAGAGGDRVGHRRVGPHPGGLERSCGAEDHRGSLLPLAGWCRCASASTPSARWPIRSRIARCCWPRSAASGGRTLRGADLSGTRLAVLETVALDESARPPGTRLRGCLQRLGRAGAQVTRITAPEVAEAMALAAVLFTSEAYGIWREVIEAAPQKMFPRILDRFRSGASVTAVDYVAGWRRLEVIRQLWADRTAVYDAVLLPTSPILPPDATG